MKTKNIFIGLISLAIIIAIGVMFFWCSGECETIKCTVQNPCNFNGKRYARGEVCANEGAICDPGWIWNCNCNTRIIGAGPANFRPTCDCN